MAEPNGAGKSRLCPFYVNIKSFDGDKLAMNLRKENANFKISLFYFGLYSENESVSRVMFRSQTGGHNVSDEVIRFNFNEGLKKAKQNLHLFDNITFIDGNSDYGKIVALHISKNGKHEVTNNPPPWFKEHFEKPFEDLLKKV